MEPKECSTAFFTNKNDGLEEEEEEEEETIHTKSSIFSQLKPHCLNLLELFQNPNKHSSSSPLPSLLLFFNSSSSASLQPFFDYTLFPLLLLLDAAVDSRSSKSETVCDKIAEGVLQCLEALFKKCRMQSVDQMVVVMKKLTYAAMLTPSEASEEFREGAIKCFRALLVNLIPCSDNACLCQQITFGLPVLLEKSGDCMKFPECDLMQGGGECLLSFLRSPAASAAVGHWLSLLLRAADAEVVRGHRGNAKIRVEAFMTLRILIAKIGTADALAFFLPGVVSQFAKVLHVSKTMISGAAGSMEAFDLAIRALAEYLMIVLDDAANLSMDVDLNVMHGSNSNSNQSIHSLLDELRHLPIRTQYWNETMAQESVEAVNSVTSGSEIKVKMSTNLDKEKESLHVERTRDWIDKTSARVAKLLSATFPHICVHPSKKVRRGLVAAIQGLLSKCGYTLKESRLMLLECLFVLIVDDSEEVAAPAQQFLEYLFSSSGKHNVQHDIAEIFSRLIEKLPKVVLGNEESLAVSHAQQLIVVIYYSGPQFVLHHLQSPVMAARFLDVFALCLSQNSVFTGALDKLMLARPSSTGYLQSVSELKASSQFSSDHHTIMDIVPSGVSKLRDIQGKGTRCLSEAVEDNYKVPHMPPWFLHVGSQKLYEVLAEILRLVGLSLMADFKNEGSILAVTDIPLGFVRKLVSEVRVKEYNRESWQSWYNRTGSGQLLRQASTAACILNEMIFGLTDQAVDNLIRMFQKSRVKRDQLQVSDGRVAGRQLCTFQDPEVTQSVWKFSKENSARSHLIDCIGRILHEYLSLEVWDLPIDHKSSFTQPDSEEITLHFFQDAAMLHQVIIDGIGVFALCLGKDFSSSGFLHSSLYLLLENLTCSNFQVRRAADAILRVLSATSGYPTVGQLVLENADYVVDSMCRQLRHLELNPHAPNVLASILSYIGVANKILPLLEEPMYSASQELEILGRHQHPGLTIPFLKAVAEIAKASKREASSLPSNAESYLIHVKSKLSEVEKEVKAESPPYSSHYDKAEQWESVLFKLNEAKRYRRTVGSIAGSCLTAATPLLTSMKQEECLVALDIVEIGIWTLANVEEAYRHEKQTKEAIEELIPSHFLYQLQDTLDAADVGADENRLLPAMNKLWPFLVACVRSKNPVAVRRCLSVVGNVVQVCGGDFFSRRFHTDGQHFWKLLSTSPFQRRPLLKEERFPLQLPYRSNPASLADSMAEGSAQKVQIALLNLIADLSRNKGSGLALEVVLKKVSGLVVGIACSGITGLRDAALSALHGLATIDPDLIWLLLADVYYSFKQKGLPSPPTSGLPQISQIFPLPSSPKEYLYVEYGGQTYGFDIDFLSVEIVFKKLHSLVFTNQMYM